MSLLVPKEAIRSLVASLTGVAVSRVVWQGEPEKTIGPIDGKAAKITLNVPAREINGTVEPRREYSATPTPSQSIQWGVHRTLTISVRADNFLGAGAAFDTLETLRFKLELPPSRKSLRAADLSFVDAPMIQSRGDYVVDTRTVSSATLDVRLAHLACTDVAPDGDGWIEKVSSSNPPDPATAPVYGLEFTRIE